jgi:hypothetical protein
MEVAAVNVGRSDLAGGLPFLREVSRETGLPWVATNLRSAGGEHPFPRWRVFEWGGTRVAVVGVLAANTARDRQLGIEVESPDKAVRDALAKAGKVDGVICLSTLNVNAERQLAREVPGLDFIVGSGGELFPYPPIEGDTVILRAADRGRYLGVLDTLPFKAGGWRRPWNLHDEEPLERQLQSLRGEIERLGRGEERPKSSKRGREAPPAVQDLQRQATAIEARLSELRASPAAFSYRIVPLDASVGEDPEVAGWVAAQKRDVAKARTRSVAQARPLAVLPVQSPGTRARGPWFTGSGACRRCHSDAYRAWVSTSHARAFASVSDRAKDTECLRCHSTGLARLTGSSVEPAVGCETCHGPGGNHRTRGNIARRPSENTCRGCHRGFHPGNSFDYARDLARIRCDRGLQ